MELNFEEILQKAKDIVLKAGEKVKEAFESREIINSSIEDKDSNPTDLVTAVDKGVEKFIFSSLKELFPTFELVGEETVSASESKKVNLTDSPTWVVDPVDGTTNFVHGFPFVCICVGLVVKKDPALGIVYNPILNEMYTGIKGKGSFMNGKQLPLIKNTPLKSLQKSLFVTEYGYFLGPEKVDIKVGNAKNMLYIPAHGVRSLGSCALDMCQVARGGADFYFEIGIHTWDLAAATVIVRESGGVVVGYKRPNGIDDKIQIADEPFDLNGRKVLCMRGVIEGKEYQSKMLGEVREKLKDFEIESD
jgi:myo-inositol-1(or 4)-monophosphatase